MRIRVHAAGVNFVDSLMVGGTYQVKPQFPFAAKRPAPAGGTYSSNPLPSSSQSASAVNPEAIGEKPGTLAAVCGWLGT